MAANTLPPNPDDGKPGRPRKLTPKLVKAAGTLIRCGCFRTTAAKRMGVGYTTFRTWMSLGRDYPDGIYGQFRAVVLKAEARAESDAIRTILADGHTLDAKFLCWFLERKFPGRWGRFRGELGELKREIADLRKLLTGETADRETPG